MTDRSSAVDLEAVRLFIQAVDVGSVHGAALRLGLSRSSLRRRIGALEHDLGAKLLVRSASGISLTQAGEVVLNEGRVMLERAARMAALARSSTRRPSGRIAVTVPVGMPDVARVAAARQLQALAPGLCLFETERADPLEHLNEPFDLMFHYGEPPAYGDWTSRVVFRAKLVPLASEAYLAEHGCPRRPEELGRHRVLSWRVGRASPTKWPLRAGGTIAVAPLLCSRNGQMMHRAAQEGLGVLLGNPEPMFLPLSQPVVPVLADQIGTEVTLRCLSPVEGGRDPRARAVLQVVHDLLDALGGP